MNVGKATRYHRLRRRTGLLTVAGSGGVLVWLLASGASAGIRDTMTQGVDVLGLPPVWRHAGVAAGYTACVWAVLEGVLLPLRFFRGFVLERRYALSSIGAVRWVSTHLKTVALSGVVVVGAAVVVSLSLVFWPAGWWVVSGTVFAVGTVLLTNLAPVCIIPLLYSVRPLARVRLRTRLAGLAKRAGVPVPRVDECAVGATTRRAHASLVGLGPTRRILLSDTLLADYSDDEIEVVLAHELGHQVHRDVWQVIAFELSVALTALLVGGWTVVRLGGSFGVVSVGDLAGLPLMVLGAGVVVVLAAPLGHALSRHHERRADLFAIRVTCNPTAFIIAGTCVPTGRRSPPASSCLLPADSSTVRTSRAVVPVARRFRPGRHPPVCRAAPSG